MSKRDKERYAAALHAVQTGVALRMSRDEQSRNTNPFTSPKQLRTGIESAFVGDAALAMLLIKKGVFTYDEYEAAMANEMENEKERYELELGPNVTLG